MNADEFTESTRALTDDQRKHLAERGKADLFFLCKGILGYSDINVRTHGPVIAFAQLEKRNRRMFLMPRSTFKSTIITIGTAIQDAIKNPDDARLLIVNEIHDNSVAFLSEIKGHFESNELFRALYADILPERTQGTGSDWSQTRASLKRALRYKDPTWDTNGVGGATTSRHYRRIIADDLIGEAALISPAKMEATIKWTGSLESLLVTPNDRIDFVGTRWMLNDLYGQVIKKYGSEIAVFRRGALEDGESIFPENIPKEFLTRLQETEPLRYYSQYGNDPQSGGLAEFPKQNLQHFTFGIDQRVHFTDIKGQPKYWPLDWLDITILVDPNGGLKTSTDNAAIDVAGVSPDGEVFTLFVKGYKPDPTQFVNDIWDIAVRWNPRMIGIEQAGQQNTLHYFERMMKEKRRTFRVQPLLHQKRNKIQRITTAVQPMLATRKLYTLASQTVLNGQIKNHPDNEHDDELDALSYLVDVEKTPIRRDILEKRNEADALLLANRNARTGY